jgi:hypothetical protein
MSRNIASKLAAVAIAIGLNGIVLGGAAYLFASRTDAAPASAQISCHASRLLAAIV